MHGISWCDVVLEGVVHIEERGKRGRGAQLRYM